MPVGALDHLERRAHDPCELERPDAGRECVAGEGVAQDVGHGGEDRPLETPRSGTYERCTRGTGSGRVLLPRGRPQRRNSRNFYAKLAQAYRAFELQGLSPVKEIARRMNVPENTVHQWVYRMRHQLHVLEPSRSRRKDQ